MLKFLRWHLTCCYHWAWAYNSYPTASLPLERLDHFQKILMN